MQGQHTARPKRRTPGIEVRHQRSCRDPSGNRCTCSPTYRAWAYDRRTGRRVRKAYDNYDEAKAWRAEATVGLRKGTMKAPSRITLRDAAETWLEGAEAGTIRTRSGDPYKPSAFRGYKAALDQRVDLQDLADRMLAEGLNASTIRNALMPLRAIFRRAVARGELAVNPTFGIELPAVRGRRDRIAAPDEAAKLIAAVPEGDRALWATAMYAGLRRGELMALRWEDVDLAAGVIRVERAWDPKERAFVTPKRRAGRRTVPIPAVLRDYLDEHKLRTGGEGLVFGRSKTEPFDASVVAGRAATAWKNAALQPITLHEARHTFASLMIAAAVNAKALSTYIWATRA
jgi:integrase